MPYTEEQDPDLDTTDTVDPNANYQPPDIPEAEPAPPPDDYSDLPGGGGAPPDLPEAVRWRITWIGQAIEPSLTTP